MLHEFRAFITRGNVLDLAVAVIIGAAFTAIVSSMTDDLIMPILGQLLGGLDFTSYFLRLGPIPQGYAGAPTDYAALKKAGVPLLGYGAFLTAVIKFVILALIIFLLVKAANRLLKQPEVTAAEAEEILLLRQIRDSLQRRQSGEL